MYPDVGFEVAKNIWYWLSQMISLLLYCEYLLKLKARETNTCQPTISAATTTNTASLFIMITSWSLNEPNYIFRIIFSFSFQEKKSNRIKHFDLLFCSFIFCLWPSAIVALISYCYCFHSFHCWREGNIFLFVVLVCSDNFDCSIMMFIHKYYYIFWTFSMDH